MTCERNLESRRRLGRGLSAALAVLVMMAMTAMKSQGDPGAAVTRVPVVFSGGHETDPRDRGRPVVLIAAALGVPADVFREAFTHVHPAPPGSGGPTPEEARANKAALMAALAPYGVTNERLDTVSNYYRYNRSRGELWPTQPATAYALFWQGRVIGYVVTSGGSGYSSPPTVTVPTITGTTVTAQLSFSKDFSTNGAVSAITLPGSKTP